MNHSTYKSLFHNSAVIAWVVLVVMTALSWYLSIDLVVGVDNAHRITTTGLFLLAFFKVRLVIIHFMEIGTAPTFLRAMFEVWVVFACCLLIGMYWFLPL